MKFTERSKLYVEIAALMIAGLFVGAAGADAQQEASPPSSVVRQSLDDAWWTGPLLANSAATLPRGHFLIEPYLYDLISPHANGFGSRACLLYGLVNRFTVGLIPIVGYNVISEGPSSSGIGLGDLTPLAQYRFTQFHEGSWIPTTALMVQETLPTGKYDRLTTISRRSFLDMSGHGYSVVCVISDVCEVAFGARVNAQDRVADS